MKSRGGLPDSEELYEVVKDMEGKGKIEVLIDDDGVIQMISFATKEMLSPYGQFPELILMDGTYKVNKYHFHVLKYFKKKVYKLLLPVDEKNELFAQLKVLVYAKDAEAFDFMMTKLAEMNEELHQYNRRTGRTANKCGWHISDRVLLLLAMIQITELYQKTANLNILCVHLPLCLSAFVNCVFTMPF